jgi:prepilin-type N-terminal cleavage/methylation domain-containing protein
VRRGFTIVELLVVLGIIGLLVGLIAPAMGMIRAESRNSACMSNLRQIFVPLRSYSDSIGGLMPICNMLPAVGDQGPEGGLPQLLKGYVATDSEMWLCPADFDPESRGTGTSYLYVPGLLRYTPEVQMQVARTVLRERDITDKARTRLRNELEGRMLRTFYEGLEKAPDGKKGGTQRESKYALVIDSQDRHPGTRQPRNALFADGTVRENTPPDEDEEAGDG